MSAVADAPRLIAYSASPCPKHSYGEGKLIEGASSKVVIPRKVDCFKVCQPLQMPHCLITYSAMSCLKLLYGEGELIEGAASNVAIPGSLTLSSCVSRCRCLTA